MNVRPAMLGVDAIRLDESAPRSRHFDATPSEAVTLATLLVDAILVVAISVAMGLAYQKIAFGGSGDVLAYAGTGALAAAIFCGTTRLLSAAARLSASTWSGRARISATAWIATFLFLAFIAFALKIGEVYSRGAVLSFFAAGLPLVMTSAAVLPRLFSRVIESNAYLGQDAIVVSAINGSAAPILMDELRSHGCSKLRRIDFDANCDDASWDAVRTGLIARIKEAARTAGPGEIYIAATSLPRERLAGILAGLRLLPRSVQVMPDDALAYLLRYGIRSVGGTVTIEVQRAPLSALQRAAKRAIDVLVAGAILLLVAPLFLIVAAAIKLNSRGPVFFLQTRNGCCGRPFRIVKFRTMTVMEDGADIVQACRNDARVTRLGRFLRSTSLDELPQLLNVLAGSMSLVGPRPHAVAHDELYAKLIENYALRQHVKPGISGWAQVNGLRGETPTVELMYRRIELDLWYAANCNLSLDLQILVRTLGVFFSRTNAY